MNKQKKNDDVAPHAEPGGARRPKDRLPPDHMVLQKLFFWTIFIVGIAAFLCAIDQVCFNTPFSSAFLRTSIKWAYIGFTAALFALILGLWLQHRQFVHEARLEDRSEVEAKIAEAVALEPWLTDPHQVEMYSGQKASLVSVVNGLWKLGPER